MDIESILNKHGRDWTREEIEEVFNWLDREGMLDRLVRFANGLTSDFELAQDVVQEKLKDAFLHIETYNPKCYKGKKCPFLNWIYYMVARKAIREAKRKAKQAPRHQTLETVLSNERVLRQHASLQTFPPEADTDWEEQWELVCHCLDRLSPKLREAVCLRYDEGLKIAEAAARAGCSSGAMKVRLYRAYHKLRRLSIRCELQAK